MHQSTARLTSRNIETLVHQRDRRAHAALIAGLAATGARVDRAEVTERHTLPDGRQVAAVFLPHETPGRWHVVVTAPRFGFGPVDEVMPDEVEVEVEDWRRERWQAGAVVSAVLGRPSRPSRRERVHELLAELVDRAATCEPGDEVLDDYLHEAEAALAALLGSAVAA